MLILLPLPPGGWGDSFAPPHSCWYGFFTGLLCYRRELQLSLHPHLSFADCVFMNSLLPNFCLQAMDPYCQCLHTHVWTCTELSIIWATGQAWSQLKWDTVMLSALPLQMGVLFVIYLVPYPFILLSVCAVIGQVCFWKCSSHRLLGRRKPQCV